MELPGEANGKVLGGSVFTEYGRQNSGIVSDTWKHFLQTIGLRDCNYPIGKYLLFSGYLFYFNNTSS